MSNTKKTTSVSNLNKLYEKDLKLTEIKKVSKEVLKSQSESQKIELLILDQQIKRSDLINESLKFWNETGKQMYKDAGHKLTNKEFASDVHGMANNLFYQSSRIGAMNKTNRDLYRDAVRLNLTTSNLKDLDKLSKSQSEFKNTDEVIEFLKPKKSDDDIKKLWSIVGEVDDRQVKATKNSKGLKVGTKNDLHEVKRLLLIAIKDVETEIEKTAKVVKQYENQKNEHFKKASEEIEILQGLTELV
jgi:hypothetical protein